MHAQCQRTMRSDTEDATPLGCDSAVQPATLALKRPVKTVILCGKLAYRVRVGDMEDPDWEVTDVFDASLTARRAVRVHLRKREPGSSFLPSHTPEWDPEFTCAGMWRESVVRVWWDRLMKVDAPIDLRRMPDRDITRARKTHEAWEEANEQFRREVLNMKPLDLSTLTVETARERERARVEEDLIRSGVPKDCAEWKEAMAAAEERAKEFGKKEIAEARVWRDEAFARDAQVLVSARFVCVCVCVCVGVDVSAFMLIVEGEGGRET